MNETDIAWAAGVMDGEGCIGYYQPHFYPLVQIAQVDRRMLDKMQELFGGSTYLAKARSARRNCQPIFQWYLVCQGALDMLVIIRPYLVVKGEQADIVLEHVMPGRGTKPSPAERAKRLDISLRLKAAK